jgi:hypothetical protein
MGLDLDAFNDLAKVDTDPDHSIIERLRFDDALEIPHQLTDVDLWLNYCNDDLYHLDKAVRDVIRKTRWARYTTGSAKTAVPLVFMQIFGRKSAPQDSRVCMMLHRLLKYYCSSFTGTSKISGQRFNHVYHFSKYAMTSKRAMSLRLRLEEANGKPIQFGSHNAGKDKRAEPRRGVTQNGPFADERGRLHD